MDTTQAELASKRTSNKRTRWWARQYQTMGWDSLLSRWHWAQMLGFAQWKSFLHQFLQPRALAHDAEHIRQDAPWVEAHPLKYGCRVRVGENSTFRSYLVWPSLCFCVLFNEGEQGKRQRPTTHEESSCVNEGCRSERWKDIWSSVIERAAAT